MIKVLKTNTIQKQKFFLNRKVSSDKLASIHSKYHSPQAKIKHFSFYGFFKVDIKIGTLGFALLSPNYD